MTKRAFPVMLGLGLSVVASAQSYYLALGDSIAYGLTPFPGGLAGYNAPSNGDRFYVRDVANAIGAVDGALPTVINLSIPGESSVTFDDLSNIYRGANTNYGSNPLFPRMVTQEDFAFEKIAALGGSIRTVSFALGANDFLSLSGELQSDPTALAAAFTSITSRYTSFLTTLRSSLPSARLILPGYYNPYLSTDPRHDPAAEVIQTLNGTIQGFASGFGGRYVDFYSVIEGRQDSLISTGDIHPNAAGYAALGGAAAQAVPEPASMAALGLGVLALIRRRK